MKAKLIVAMAIGLGLSTAFSAKKQPEGFWAKPESKKVKADPADCVLESLEGSGIGDIKYSVLSESDFQAVHGNEWVQLKGQTISTLDYGTYDTANGTIASQINSGGYDDTSKLPDASGVFLRAMNMSGGTVGNPEGATLGESKGYMTALPTVTPFQTSGDGAHQHFVVTGLAGDQTSNATISETTYLAATDGSAGTSYQEEYGLDGVSTPANYGLTSVGGFHSHLVESGGDVETRPKNVTVNVFVKIRRACVNKTITDSLRFAYCGANDTTSYPQGCFGTDLSDNDKVSCLKESLEEWEAGSDNKVWSSTCLKQIVGTAKQVLIEMGSNKSSEQEAWYDEIVRQYPYYYAIIPSVQ